jgi:hypothetical protein
MGGLQEDYIMKIGYIGGFWATNIGNSFYNLGALHFLKEVFGKDDVYFIPDPPQEYWSTIKHDYKWIQNLDLDLFIITGPSFNKSHLQVFKPIFDELKRKNKKIAYLSVSASAYTEEEASLVSDFINEYPVEFIMTRDEVTYNLYKDKVKTKIFNGICTSMYLNDAVNVPLVNDDYIVSNFSYFKEPKIEFKNDQWVYSHSFIPKFQNEIDGHKVVKPNNSFFIPTFPKIHKGELVFNRGNTYYSDLPYGYLSILKSAKKVFSDRVHTCAATLILGGYAMYIKGSKRSGDGRKNIFSRIGLGEIFEKPVKLDFDLIMKEKIKMKIFLDEYKKNI